MAQSNPHSAVHHFFNNADIATKALMFPFRGYSGNCKSKLNFEEVLLGRNLLLVVTLLFSTVKTYLKKLCW